MKVHAVIEDSPEPGTNFTIGRQKWGVAWPLFFNTFGVLFALLFLLALMNIYSLVVLSKKKTFQRRRVFLVVNIVLAYFTCVTSLTLLIDPYNSGEHFEVIKFRGIIFLFDGLRLPCITASFSLITMSLLEATKLQLYSPRLQNYKVIIGIIVFHFLLVFTINLVLLFIRDLMVVLLVCQVGVVLIGFVISITSLYTGYRVVTYSNRSRKILDGTASLRLDDKESMDTTKHHCSVVKQQSVFRASKDFKDQSVKKIARICIVTSVFGILCSLLTMYLLISDFQRSTEESGDVWLWYAVNVCLKFTELGMVTSMLYIVRRVKLMQLIRHCWMK